MAAAASVSLDQSNGPVSNFQKGTEEISTPISHTPLSPGRVPHQSTALGSTSDNGTKGSTTTPNTTTNASPLIAGAVAATSGQGAVQGTGISKVPKEKKLFRSISRFWSSGKSKSKLQNPSSSTNNNTTTTATTTTSMTNHPANTTHTESESGASNGHKRKSSKSIPVVGGLIGGGGGGLLGGGAGAGAGSGFGVNNKNEGETLNSGRTHSDDTSSRVSTKADSELQGGADEDASIRPITPSSITGRSSIASGIGTTSTSAAGSTHGTFRSYASTKPTTLLSVDSGGAGGGGGGGGGANRIAVVAGTGWSPPSAHPHPSTRSTLGNAAAPTQRIGGSHLSTVEPDHSSAISGAVDDGIHRPATTSTSSSPSIPSVSPLPSPSTPRVGDSSTMTGIFGSEMNSSDPGSFSPPATPFSSSKMNQDVNSSNSSPIYPSGLAGEDHGHVSNDINNETNTKTLMTSQVPHHTIAHPRNNPHPASYPHDNASMLTLASSSFAPSISRGVNGYGQGQVQGQGQGQGNVGGVLSGVSALGSGGGSGNGLGPASLLGDRASSLRVGSGGDKMMLADEDASVRALAGSRRASEDSLGGKSTWSAGFGLLAGGAGVGSGVAAATSSGLAGSVLSREKREGSLRTVGTTDTKEDPVSAEGGGGSVVKGDTLTHEKDQEAAGEETEAQKVVRKEEIREEVKRAASQGGGVQPTEAESSSGPTQVPTVKNLPSSTTTDGAELETLMLPPAIPQFSPSFGMGGLLTPGAISSATSSQSPLFNADTVTHSSSPLGVVTDRTPSFLSESGLKTPLASTGEGFGGSEVTQHHGQRSMSVASGYESARSHSDSGSFVDARDGTAV